MADYDLGTAHGKIIVTYDDRGVAEAEKSLDRLKRKSRELLGQFGAMVKGWRTAASDLSAGAQQINRDFTSAAQGIAVLGTALSVLNKDVIGTVQGVGLIRSFGEALGHLPDGADKFPSVVKRIIQVSAAVTLFSGATSLLARSTRGLAGISVLTRGLASLGGMLNSAAAPLRFIASGFLGFLTVLKGFSVVKQYAKYALGFNGALAALYGGLKALSSVAQSVRDLSGLVFLLPAAAGAAAFGLVALKVATQGFGDAMKAMGDPAKFAEALKKLSPEAQTAAKAVQGLQKEWKKLQQDVQNKLFAGLGPEITKVANAYLPMLREGFGRIATAANGAAKGVAGVLTSTSGLNQAKSMTSDFARIWENLLKAVPALARILLDVGTVGARVLGNLTTNVGKAADKFADWIAKVSRNGEMESWINRGITAVKNFITALKNIAQISKIVFKGLGVSAGQPFLTWLATATQKVKEFFQSAQGQAVLSTLGTMLQNAADHAKKLADAFVQYVVPAIQAFLPFMQTMGGAVTDGLVNAMKILGPIFQTLGQVLSTLAPALGPIVTIMVTIGATMLGLGVALKIASGAFAIFRTAVMGLRAIEGVLGLLGRATGAVRLFAGAAKLIKGGVIAAGLFLIADGLDRVNMKAVGGDESKLGYMEGELHNLVAAGKEIANGNFEQIFADISDEWNQMVDSFKSGESPVGQFSKDIAQFQMDVNKAIDDFVTNLPTNIQKGFDNAKMEVGKFFVGMGTDLQNGFNGAMNSIGTFFSGIGPKIGTALSTAGADVKAAAGKIWTDFLTGVREKFAPVIAFFQQSPREMGFAIGSAIGDFLKRGQDLGTNFLNGLKIGWANVTAWFLGLPAQIDAALLNLKISIGTWAVNTWNEFTNSAKKSGDDIANEVTNLPTKLQGGFDNLKIQVGMWAVNTWNEFLTWTRTKTDEVVTWVQGLPARIGAGLASLGADLREKATTAWNEFLNSQRQKGEEIAAWVRSLPGKIKSALGDLKGLLLAQGKAVIDGLLAGIKAGVQAMYDFVSGIAAGIAARKGPISYDKRLLIPAGVAIIQGLMRGMQMTLPQLWKQIRDINHGLGAIGATTATNINVNGQGTGSPSVAALIGAPAWSTFAPSGGDGAKAPDTYNIESVTIDAKTIAEMQSVSDFFDKVQQTARAGKAT